MQNVNEKPLKIFLNSNHVIETYSVTVPSNKCFSLHSFKQQLANQIHELYLTTFAVKWRNSDGVELEMSCDEDFDDVFPRVAVVYVYLTQTVFPSKEVEETVKVEEGGLKQMLQYLPSFLASFPTTKNSERLSELLKEVVDILESDGVVANAEILDFVEQSASALEASFDNQSFRMYEGLAQLQQMGFQDDNQYLLSLLLRYQGNVTAVVNAIRAL